MIKKEVTKKVLFDVKVNVWYKLRVLQWKSYNLMKIIGEKFSPLSMTHHGLDSAVTGSSLPDWQRQALDMGWHHQPGVETPGCHMLPFHGCFIQFHTWSTAWD
ncbi:hypothetical protein [Shivajiella indica]|uniref:Uncharacterized protein n=1 Tax=Shivajiella indica TaxID=872115 RepID=A0ABW5B603_9BACT